jgi:Flp pilus assembly pilin Flp
MTHLQRFIREEDGQDVVEYGLLVATIGLIVLVATGAFGNEVSTWFSKLAAKITTNT